MSGVYDLNDPAERERLAAERVSVPRTPRERRLKAALALPNKEARRAYLGQVRAEHGPAAADDLLEDLRAEAQRRGSGHSGAAPQRGYEHE